LHKENNIFGEKNFKGDILNFEFAYAYREDTFG
jgi:hypothetical protein